MKRGDIVLAAIQGDYGKVRPAIIVQSDLFNATNASVIICPCTSELNDSPLLRLTIHPSGSNGLLDVSQIMVDKVMALARHRIRGHIGELDNENMLMLGRLLSVVLNIAGG